MAEEELPNLTPSSSVYSERSEELVAAQARFVPQGINPYSESLWLFSRGDNGSEIKALQRDSSVRFVEPHETAIVKPDAISRNRRQATRKPLDDSIQNLVLCERQYCNYLRYCVEAQAEFARNLDTRHKIMLYGTLSILSELSENFLGYLIEALNETAGVEFLAPEKPTSTSLPSEANLIQIVHAANYENLKLGTIFSFYSSRLQSALGSYLSSQHQRLEIARDIHSLHSQHLEEEFKSLQDFERVFNRPVSRINELNCEVAEILEKSKMLLCKNEQILLRSCKDQLAKIIKEPPLPPRPKIESLPLNHDSSNAKDYMLIAFQLKHKSSSLRQLERDVSYSAQAFGDLVSFIVEAAYDYKMNTQDATAVIQFGPSSASHPYVLSPYDVYLNKVTEQQKAFRELKPKFLAIAKHLKSLADWCDNLWLQVNRTSDSLRKQGVLKRILSKHPEPQISRRDSSFINQLSEAHQLLNLAVEKIFHLYYNASLEFLRLISGEPTIIRNWNTIVESYTNTVAHNRQALIYQDKNIENSPLFKKLYS
ncbi:unnamed protein product [Kuraishia capsulata CBS 1993]|uniref:DH domain-containing protein n=1 Tax=Kuraishia capsulata CBS 1993 TaxID=1382522 RepID=W6MKM2_9ASCO|nr:uncharacterized protein KUCA_T00002918001 [Kuraishia capsulata CBS 1993]CDK26941.1 unnamed protein product [Kuraishia capsulata CBS 1993]